ERDAVVLRQTLRDAGLQRTLLRFDRNLLLFLVLVALGRLVRIRLLDLQACLEVDRALQRVLVAERHRIGAVRGHVVASRAGDVDTEATAAVHAEVGVQPSVGRLLSEPRGLEAEARLPRRLAAERARRRLQVLRWIAARIGAG